MADYDIQCKHSLFIISTLYFGFFIKGMVMDSFTAKKLLSNIKEKYKFPQEVIDFEDLSIVIKVLNYLLDKSDKGVENKNVYYANDVETNLFTRDSL